jgi:hypothetical protein
VENVEETMEFEFYLKIRAKGGKYFESKPFYLPVVKEIPPIEFYFA